MSIPSKERAASSHYTCIATHEAYAKQVPMASVSGLAVASLQLLNERYRPYKGTCMRLCVLCVYV